LGKILDTALCAVTAVIPGYAQGMQFETGNGQLSLVMGG
jgi:hydrogenase/urease accessory protein HupE